MNNTKNGIDLGNTIFFLIITTFLMFGFTIIAISSVLTQFCYNNVVIPICVFSAVGIVAMILVTSIIRKKTDLNVKINLTKTKEKLLGIRKQKQLIEKHICSTCGMESDTNFCPGCGAKLE